MKCLFVINEQLSDQQIERQYLLMIAMLNFDFEVNLVFMDGAHEMWLNHESHTKHLNALTMYGAKCHSFTTSFNSSEHKHDLLNQAAFNALKNDMDFIS
ncbi:hypothetical protein [Marinicella litoralis]|uniref:DsrE/DsrF/DsrH-like protein n=1 Tax=Marinicella litoralis TaxID=644220 RepID=A0A4V3DIN1_9GAMM|nr:hypothetical protein [Marinicella litoralis]TDR22781.1 hypothetical protein C8D91_1274 [Marinicella litoralis]